MSKHTSKWPCTSQSQAHQNHRALSFGFKWFSEIRLILSLRLALDPGGLGGEQRGYQVYIDVWLEGWVKKEKKIQQHLKLSRLFFPILRSNFSIEWISFSLIKCYWATRSPTRSFVRTAHSFPCSALLASLARSAALFLSLTRSLTQIRQFDIV